MFMYVVGGDQVCVIVFACVPMSVSSTELLGGRVATDDAISRTQSIRLAVVGHGN